MDATTHTHESNDKTRTAPSGCLDGGPLDAAAQDSVFIVADDSAAPYKAPETTSEVFGDSPHATITPLALGQEFEHPTTAREPEEAMAGAAAAASAAAAATLAPPLDSRWPSSTTEAHTSAALPRADATAYPSLPATCSDRSSGASVGTLLLGSDICIGSPTNSNGFCCLRLWFLLCVQKQVQKTFFQILAHQAMRTWSRLQSTDIPTESFLFSGLHAGSTRLQPTCK